MNATPICGDESGAIAERAPYLSINNIEVIYDHVILVLKGVSLEVPRGQDRRLARRQRRGQDDDAEGDLESALRRARSGDQGHDRAQGRAHRPPDAASAGEDGRVPGDGRTPLLPAPERGGEPADGRLHAQRFARRHTRRPRARVPLFSAPQDATLEPRRLHVGRRAADDRGGTRADGASVDDPARRAVDGPRAADRRGDLRDRPRPEPEGERELPARGAEHQRGAAFRRLRIHPRERPRRHGRRGAGPRAERGREGVLSRPVDGGAQVVSRREALSAAQALARRDATPPPAWRRRRRNIPDERLFRQRSRRASPELREREQFAALRAQIAHAKARRAGVRATVRAASIRRTSRTRAGAGAAAGHAQVGAGRHAEGQHRRSAAWRRSAWGDARLVFASPGPIYEPEGAAADYWRLARALHAAGFRRGDLVHNCFSYHFTPGGAMLESGAHALGCTVFRGGVGQTEQQVQAMAQLRPDGYVGTPSFLKIILDKADELGVALPRFKKALVSGEAFLPSLRAVARGARHRRPPGLCKRRSRQHRLRVVGGRRAHRRRRRAARTRAARHRRSRRRRARSARSSSRCCTTPTIR